MADYTDPGLAIKKLAANVKARMAGQDQALAKVGRTTAPVVNVSAYGAATDGIMDATSAIRAAAQQLITGGAPGVLFFPPGRYAVKLQEGESLVTLTGVHGITIEGDRATLVDQSTYRQAGPMMNMFLIDGCRDITVRGIAYEGTPLGNPVQLLGYQGGNFVRAINGTAGLTVDATLTNARYGVQSGAYESGALGRCQNLDLTIRGSMVGYPVALYNASNIRHTIDVAGVHRAAYIAGCAGVTGTVHFRDQYIADTAYLITDAIVYGSDAEAQADPIGSPTKSRGTSSVDIEIVETGSTVMQPTSVVAGIGLSRVDPCSFRNITLAITAAPADDMHGMTMGGFRIASAAKSVQSRYPNNWEAFTSIEDVSVALNLDHSAQTAATGRRDLNINTYDGTTAATVRNLVVTGVIRKSPADTNPDFIMGRKFLGGRFDLDHDGTILLWTPGGTVNLSGRFNTLDLSSAAGTVNLTNATVTKAIGNGSGVNNATTGGNTHIGGAGVVRRFADRTLDLAAGGTWTAAIPAGATVVAVTSRVQTAITGATGYTLGVPGALDRYASAAASTAGATTGPLSAKDTETGPRLYRAATDLVVTPTGGSALTGAVRVVVIYDVAQVPTS